MTTFQKFSLELWAAGLAQLPFPRFWISWTEATNSRDRTPVSLGALCVHARDSSPGDAEGIAIYPMVFAPRARSHFENDRLVFTSRMNVMWLGESAMRVTKGDNTQIGMEGVRSATRAVFAVLGALGTPKVQRHTDPAPEKLNKDRRLKGKPEIRSQIVIDLTPERNLDRTLGSGGGWSVKPHWRRGHIRTLGDGRRVPIPPCCVNMEAGMPVKPEYMVLSPA